MHRNDADVTVAVVITATLLFVTIGIFVFVSFASWQRVFLWRIDDHTLLFRYCFVFAFAAFVLSVVNILVRGFQVSNGIGLWVIRVELLTLLVLVHAHGYLASHTVAAGSVLVAAVGACSVTVLGMFFYDVDIWCLTADAIFAASLILAFVAFVGWDWLMVREISSVFASASLRDGNFFSVTDTLELSDELDVATAVSEVNFDGRGSILMALFCRWGATYAMLAVVRLVYDFGGLLPAYLLRHLVDNLTQTGYDKCAESAKGKSGNCEERGMDLQASVRIVLFILLSTIVSTFLRVHYNLKLQRIALYNRGLLSAELYRCALCRRKCHFTGKTHGDIVNHLTVDVQRVADAVQTLNDLWALPVQLVIALYLLYVQLSFAFFAGVLVTLLLIPINAVLTKRIKHVQTNLMKENDERILTLTEIISNMTYVKMCGWSRMAREWVETPRRAYMHYLRWLKYLDAVCVFFWAVTPTLVSLLTFMTFTWMGGHLTPGKAVAALALFGSLILPLNAYPWVINGFIEAYVSWKRIQSFFILPRDGNGVWIQTTPESSSGLNQRSLHSQFLTRTYGDECPREMTYLLQMSDTTVSTDVEKDIKMSEVAAYSRSIDALESSPVSVVREFSDFLIDIQNGLLEVDVAASKMTVKDDTIDANDHFHTLRRTSTENTPLITQPFVLRIPFFFASPCQLIAIIGQAGSGKTSLLDALAGETTLTGLVTWVSRRSMAYVEQQPFLMTGTVRENILFGHSYYEERYNAALSAVALEEDLNSLPLGDATEVGDRGVCLSGGQRARVALARVVYAARDLWLVDDLLGCLDATVARHVVVETFVKAVKLHQRCIVVVTHSAEVLRCADVVYVCSDGMLNRITYLPERNFVSLIGNEEYSPSAMEIISDEIEFQRETSMEQEIVVASSIEQTEQGSLAWGTVFCYIRCIGWLLTVCIVVLAAAMQAARNASDQFVIFWSHDEANKDSAGFIRVLGFLTMLNGLLALCRGFTFALGGLQAAQRLHDELLRHVLSATHTFLTITPPGRIISRLSTDVYVIDESLPFIANILLAQSFLLIGALFVIVLNSTVIMVLALFPLFLLYYIIQRPYRQLSRELRRLEGATRAPLVDNLRNILDGGVARRSLGTSAVTAQLEGVQVDLCVSLQVQYNTILLGAWFALRMELVGVLFLLLVGVVAVASRGGTHAAALGLALAYVQPLTSYVSGALGAFSSTEKELISVERVRQYLSITQETEDEKGEVHEDSQFLKTWPNTGEVEFKDVSLTYDGPPVLRNLSFHVLAGERVAIVGRTGAGKSSIFASLLRLMPLLSGCITVDGFNTAHISREALRRRLGVLPQQPFVFHGTLRANVDPFTQYTDDAVHEALHSVGLESLGLQFVVLSGGGNLSGGQRHQVGLARVLLQRSRLLLLDEPVSQCSSESEASLWRVLATQLHDTTVLCITHKIEHMDFFDRVLVIDKGILSTSGSPAQLRRDGVWPFVSEGHVSF